mgnify:CR=1 FL=1
MNRRQAKKKYKQLHGYNPAKTLIRLFKKQFEKKKIVEMPGEVAKMLRNSRQKDIQTKITRNW